MLVFEMCLFLSKKIVSKITWLQPENLYISKSVKRIEAFTCREVLKHILALGHF